MTPISFSSPTRYTQTIRETEYDDQGVVTKTIDYTFGHDEISQTVTEGGQTTTHVFGHDGHGSVRVLYDLASTAATIAQAFTFAAYGQMIAVHGADGVFVPGAEAAALTSLGYSGEHFDATAQQQYLRARFYNPANGQFNRLDPFAGNMQDPQSLHKHTYVHGDPIGGVDPTGRFLAGSGTLAAIGIALGQVLPEVNSGVTVIGILEYAGRPAFELRAAGLLAIAAGDLGIGFMQYNVGSVVASIVLGTLDSFDVAALIGAGAALTLAAIKIAKNAPEIAQSLVSGAKFVCRTAKNLSKQSASVGTALVNLVEEAPDTIGRWFARYNASGDETFSARLHHDTDELGIAWTDNMFEVMSNVAEIQSHMGRNIPKISGTASDALEARIKAGKFNGTLYEKQLNRSLGGTWKVEAVRRTDVSNEVWEVVAVRTG